MPYFTEQEVKAIEMLKFDPSLTPIFDPLRDCLIWKDEDPYLADESPLVLGGPSYEKMLATLATEKLSFSHEKIIDLWIARSFIHQGLPKSKWYAIEPTDYFVNTWEAAVAQRVKWPGFQRLTLSLEDREYLEKMKKKTRNRGEP